MALDLSAVGDLVRQAQEIQKKVAERQAHLAGQTIEAVVGGGMVKVTANGSGLLTDIRLEREVINPEEADMLRDLILAAANEALRKVQALAAEEMRQLTGGLKLPGLPY
ncbi:MAG: YbaB/EbfC family nucleoid-associated protein [Candidatus Adiutrix sp.]|jgi:DNA-binding YbaB/EbfC family protein|nr:YbaB/EbfC family nucleoid-associated protein [Candidatus Adiutrix sp.]